VGQQHAPAAVPATKQQGHGKIIKNSAMAPKSDQTQEQRESGGLQRIPIEAKLFKRIPKDHVRQKIQQESRRRGGTTNDEIQHKRRNTRRTFQTCPWPACPGKPYIYFR
jgi:hypothetical protein